MAKGKLTKQAKIFIIQQLAMFEKPVGVQDSLREIFEIEIALPSVMYYDISNLSLPDQWKEIFIKTREAFLTDATTIAIANKSFRLKELDRLYHKGKTSKLENPVEQRATLEQAAKESGDAFTNKRVIDLNNVSELPDEDLLAIVNSKG